LVFNKLNNPFFIGLYILALMAGSNFITIEIGNYHLFFSRLLTFILPFLIITKSCLIRLKNSEYVKLLFLVVIVFLIWSGASYFWAKDKTAVIVNCFYIISGVLSGINLILFAFDSNFKITDTFVKGWHIAWLGLVVFAYLEILFNFHIHGHFSDFLQKQQPGIPAFDSVLSLFDGPNEFGTYLVISLPFSIYFLSKRPILFIGVLMITFQFLYRNDAKFCLIAFVIFIISLSMVYRDKLKKLIFPSIIRYNKLIIMLILFILTILTTNKLVKNKTDDYSIYSSFESNISGLHLNENKHLIKDSTPSMTSFEIRWNLILNGYTFLVQYPLTGIGAGNFEHYMSTQQNLLPTKSIVNSHSWLTQTISENGIIIGSFYWFILGYLLFKNYKYFYKSKPKHIQKFLAINLLITFAIVSNVSSSFAPSPLNWSIFCLLFVAFQGKDEINEID
jgi:hypothetical protein